MSETLMVYAPAHFDPADSYGLIGCELVRHLNRLGVRAYAGGLGFPQHKNQDEEVAAYTARPVELSTGGLLLGYPTVHAKYNQLAQYGKKIAVTMFESSRIPAEWIDPLNDCHAVVVPTEFCEILFRDSGVKSPIHVFPLGIDDRYIPKRREENRPFTFLAFVDRGRRKGGLFALEAFVNEFGDDPNVKLILKHRIVPDNKQVNIVNDNIDLIYADYTVEELRDLYYGCDCLINPNKGEGFGLLPREFAATGGISLATNWGGTSEMIDHWGYPIDYTLEIADWSGNRNLEGKELGLWAVPSKEDLQTKMRWIYEHKEEFACKSYNNAFYIPIMYSWKRFAKNILNVWRSLCP